MNILKIFAIVVSGATQAEKDAAWDKIVNHRPRVKMTDVATPLGGGRWKTKYGNQTFRDSGGGKFTITKE